MSQPEHLLRVIVVAALHEILPSPFCPIKEASVRFRGLPRLELEWHAHKSTMGPSQYFGL